MAPMKQPASKFPPGGEPYHPREMGADAEVTIVKRTGLLGVLFLLGTVWATMLLAILSIPFVLFGVMEFVATTPNSWRVRWIRNDS